MHSLQLTHAIASFPRARNQVLRDLSARKNLEFRRRMIGRRLPAVTVSNHGVAITTNYIRVELNQPQPASTALEVTLGAVTSRGMREASPLQVLG